MMRVGLRIAYLGTHFSGFQVQPDKRTVQGELSRCLAEYFGAPVTVTGCSRTDSGVHARDFHAVIEVDGESAVSVPTERLPLALRPYLPSDLSVLSAFDVPSDFHVRHDVVSKEYRYTVYRAFAPDPFLADRAWHLVHKFKDGYLDAMREAAAHLVGRHDFAAFMAQGSQVSDTVRTVFRIGIEEEDACITFSVVGDGFLYNMVRIIVGTLIDVAKGKLAADDVLCILRSRDRKNAGQTAPPEGLCLWKVLY
jgi:tRNA pseudouridine38-40 synthase